MYAADVGCRDCHEMPDRTIVRPVPQRCVDCHDQDYADLQREWLAEFVGLRRAMELMLTGDHMSGIEAAECGFANRAFPAESLESSVLGIASRVAQVPSDLQQINKRAVHRQMDAMGIRAGIRAGTEMQQLATYTASTQAHLAELRQGLTEALSKRDAAFGDYRTQSDSEGN